jgi:tetratricopeptide (TPR) repeat protein
VGADSVRATTPRRAVVRHLGGTLILHNRELALSLGPAFYLAVGGRHREALAQFDDGIEASGNDFQLGRQILGQSAVIFVILYRGVVLIDLGRLREAREAVDNALRLARENDDIECLDWAHGTIAFVCWAAGEPGDGLAHARESLKIAEHIGSSFSRAIARMNLGLAHLAREEHGDARAVIEEALEIMRKTRTGLLYEPVLLRELSEARLGLHDVEGARTAAAEGAAIAGGRGARVQEAGCRMALGRALLPDRPDDARAELERALALSGEDGPLYIPHVLLALGDLAGLRGDERERRRRLEEARRLFGEQGATGHARRAAAAIAAAAA